jgi:hypothetical protein
MEIHSSSLMFSPVGHNRQLIGKNDSAQNKNGANELSIVKKSHSPRFERVLSPDEIKETLDNANLSLDRHNTYKPTDIRILKALNAYHQEINQPLLDQRIELITGIDTYA